MIDLEDTLKKIEGELFIRDFLNKSIVNTVVKECSNLHEIYNLSEEDFLQLRGAGKAKVKYLTEFKTWTDNHYHVIKDYYEFVVNFRVVPSSVQHDKSIFYNLYEALKEIRKIINIKISLPYTGDSTQLGIYKNQASKANGWIKRSEINENFIDLIDWYFGLAGNEILSKNEIGLRKNFDSYNVNHIIIKSLKVLFFEGEIKYGIQLNKELHEAAVEELEKSFYKNYEASTLIENNFRNIDLFCNVIELFEADLIKSNTEEEMTEYVIVPSRKGSIYRTNRDYLNSLFLYGRSFTLDEILDINSVQEKSQLINKSTFKSIKKNGGLDINILESILNSSNKIEKIKNDSNELAYQYKWQFLHGDNNRIDRILLEEGGVKSEYEIIELFNQRANNYDNINEKEVGSVKMSTSKNILPIGKTRNWIHKKYLDKNLRDSLSVNLQTHIDQLLSDKFDGKASLTEIKNSLSKEILLAYPDSSIKVYLQNIAFQSQDDPQVFIHKEHLIKYPEISLKRKKNKFFGNELFLFTVNLLKSERDSRIEERFYFDLVSEEYPDLAKSNLYFYLNKFSEKRLVLPENIDTKTYLRLDLDELENYDLEKLFKAEEPAYRVKIRAKVVEALKRTSNQKTPLSTLAKNYLELLPEGYARTNFYKILNDSTLFRKVEDNQGTVWIELVKEYLPAAKTSHEEVVDEPAKKDEELNLVLRQEVDLSLLKTTCFSEILDEGRRFGLDEELLEKSFNTFLGALQKNDGVSFKRYGNQLLQSVFQFLIGKTDVYDREICFSILISSYQTYLSNLLNNDSYYPGQTALFLSNPKIEKLWKYKFEPDADDKTWLTFSKILHSLKYFSDIDRHQKDHPDLSMNAIKRTKNIIDFIALYLFTAYIVSDRERAIVQ